jgi:hypothetical protein
MINPELVKAPTLCLLRGGQSRRGDGLGPSSKVDEDEQLPVGMMAGNVTLAGHILREHDAACGNFADVAVARLEFHFAREPDHQLAARRVMPIPSRMLDGTRQKLQPRGRDRIREAQWIIVLKNLLWQ